MRHVLVAGLVALLLGCQQSPAPGPQQAPLGSLTAKLRAEGDRLAAGGDYAGAVVKYEAAVSQERGDSALWFALGVALSHLDRRDETVEAFSRVLDLGTAESDEVRLARGWLVRAGVLAEAVSFAPSAVRESSEPTKASYHGPTGSLEVRTGWEGLGPKSRLSTSIALSGGDGAASWNFSRQVKLGESSVFEKVPPGTYRVTARSGATQLWEQSVTITEGSQTTLDLSPANSLVSPDEFPVRSPDYENLEEQIKHWKMTS